MKCYDRHFEDDKQWEEKALTVADLIAYLRTLPQNYEVGVNSDEYSFQRPFNVKDDIEIFINDRLIFL